MAIMEMVKHMDNEIVEVPRRVAYNNGFVIENVPHEEHIEIIGDQKFTEYLLDGKTSLILSIITEYMKNNSISNFDFSQYQENNSIMELINKYLGKYLH